MSLVNFFVVPSSVENITCKSGNVYVPVNNVITNVVSGDILDVINSGGRQVAGGDDGVALPWVASRFYTGIDGATFATVLTVLGTIYALPIYVAGNVPVASLGVNVLTGQTGGAARIGLYADLNGAPGALVSGSDAGAVAATGTAIGSNTFSTPITLSRGWYWAASAYTASSTMPSVAGNTNAFTSALNGLLGSDTALHALGQSAASAVSGVSAAFTYGALPATFPTASYALVVNAVTPALVLGT